MYIKRKDRELFKKIDESLDIPKGFIEYVDKERVTHNLIIRAAKNICTCSNCKTIFRRNKFKNLNEIRCPNCRNTYEVKTSKLKSYYFEDYISIIQKYEDYWIQRYFMYRTEITFPDYKKTNYIVEYCREIFNEEMRCLYSIENDNVLNYISNSSIKYYSEMLNSNWKYRTYSYHSIYAPPYIKVYPGNLKKLLKNTKLKYSMIWELAKHIDINFSYLYKNNFKCIELLTKLKLYKLTYNPNNFEKEGSFEKRFGVTKNYYPFMKKNNIDAEELKILKRIKKKNIILIRKLVEIETDILPLEIDLILATKLTDLCKANIIEYRDYIRMCKDLKYDLKDKRILYPKNIKDAHDNILKFYNLNKNKIIDGKIKSRFTELKDNSYEDNKYIIFPVKSMNELIDESEQMHNCVKTYAEDYSNGECDLYLMRYINNQNESLVTVEVRNKKVVQARRKFNKEVAKEDNKFLKKFEIKLIEMEGK